MRDIPASYVSLPEGNTVDGSDIRRSAVEVKVVEIPLFTGTWYIPGGCWGFLHQQYGRAKKKKRMDDDHYMSLREGIVRETSQKVGFPCHFKMSQNWGDQQNVERKW